MARAAATKRAATVRARAPATAAAATAAEPGAQLAERILDVGAQLFSEHGYEAVSLRDICEAAGVSKGAIYHHFLSKEHLLADIVVSALKALLEHIERDIGGATGAGDRLRRFIVSQVEFFESHSRSFRVAMSRFAAVSDPALQREIDTLRRRYVRLIRDIITDGITAGEFRDIDAGAATRMVLAILYWFGRWYSPNGRTGAIEIAEKHADIMLRGVLKP
jgi:AcrR family transcriptional regulator